MGFPTTTAVASRALILILEGEDDKAQKLMSKYLHVIDAVRAKARAENTIRDEDLMENQPNHLEDIIIEAKADVIPTAGELWNQTAQPLPERRSAETTQIRIAAEHSKRYGEHPSFFRAGRALWAWMR
jgi:hypothetical protein